MKKTTTIILGLAIMAYIALQTLGASGQMVGMSMFGIFIFLTALIFFIKGTRPFIKHENLKTVRLVRLGTGCLVFSALIIPFWSLITWRFPPDKFNTATAWVATASLLIAVFGSAAPTIQRLYSGLVELNRVQREEIKRRKNRQQSVPSNPHSPSAQGAGGPLTFGRKIMITPRKPVCGILSVLFPLFGLSLGYFGAYFVATPADGSHQATVAVAVFMLLSFGFVVAGIIMGILGWIRSERHYWVSIMGFILSLFIAFSYFVMP